MALLGFFIERGIFPNLYDFLPPYAAIGNQLNISRCAPYTGTLNQDGLPIELLRLWLYFLSLKSPLNTHITPLVKIILRFSRVREDIIISSLAPANRYGKCIH